MIFSPLTLQFNQPTNRLYQERRRLETQGVKLLDLISGNVTEQGIRFPPSVLSRALHSALPLSAAYRPHPLGQLAARRAIARYYHSEGLPVPPEQLVLTPGTSLAYAYIFQTLAAPGDEILCPRPSYPLFEMIAAAAHVDITSYKLRENSRWQIDFESLESAITPRTRAIALVSPHNPTGTVATSDELETLAKIARRHNLPIIADEVFGPFLSGELPLPRPAGTSAPLVLTLNGFSKMFALPGIKLGWILVSGDAAHVKTILQSLETLSDSFLPVNEIVQTAVPAIFKEGAAFLPGYQANVRRRRETAEKLLAKIAETHFIPSEGGFYAALAIPGHDEEQICWQLLTRYHTVMHPGFFYDLEGSHLVMSTVHRPSALQRGLRALKKLLARTTSRA